MRAVLVVLMNRVFAVSFAKTLGTAEKLGRILYRKKYRAPAPDLKRILSANQKYILPQEVDRRLHVLERVCQIPTVNPRGDVIASIFARRTE